MRLSTLWLVGMVLVLSAVSLAFGDQPIPLGKLAATLVDSGRTDPVASMIVMDVRLPRIVMALLAGGALGVSGVLAQTVLRNPLAEPGLLGINSGAALTVTILMVTIAAPPPGLLPVAAFAGALTVAAAIYAVAAITGPSPIRLVLIGVGFGALAGSFATGVSLLGDVTTAQRIMAWLTGSVYNSTWDSVFATTLWLVLPVMASLLMSRELDLLMLGDDVATGLGQPVQLVRAGAIALCALLAAISVSAAGALVFVGLIAPHLARTLVGRRHIALLPVAGLTGGLVVLVADLVGRSVLPPVQIPAGLVTPLIGAPFFAALVWHRNLKTAHV